MLADTRKERQMPKPHGYSALRQDIFCCYAPYGEESQRLHGVPSVKVRFVEITSPESGGLCLALVFCS